MLPYKLGRVSKVPGVYLVLDLDGRPAYVGKARRSVQSRLTRHFISQSSDVVTDGLLDIYEAWKVLIWYAPPEDLLPLETELDPFRGKDVDMLEAALYRQHEPRWNRSPIKREGQVPAMPLESACCTIEIVEGEELARRRSEGQRIETKLLHLLRAVRKARIAGASRDLRWGLRQHVRDLYEVCERSLRKPW